MAMGDAAFRSLLAACALLLACSGSEPEAAPTEPPPAPPVSPVSPAPVPPAPEPAPAAPAPGASAPQLAPEPLPQPQAPAPDPPAAADSISLEDLGERIRATPAIGAFTKLALKNDIDDLVDDLRAYHREHRGDLDDLHQRYEALVLKLLALLEDDEPELALALSRSREDIWSRLVNPVEFAKLPT